MNILNAGTGRPEAFRIHTDKHISLCTSALAANNSINIGLFSEHQSIPNDTNAIGIYRERWWHRTVKNSFVTLLPLIELINSITAVAANVICRINHMENKPWTFF